MRSAGCTTWAWCPAIRPTPPSTSLRASARVSGAWKMPELEIPVRDRAEHVDPWLVSRRASRQCRPAWSRARKTPLALALRHCVKASRPSVSFPASTRRTSPSAAAPTVLMPRAASAETVSSKSRHALVENVIVGERQQELLRLDPGCLDDAVEKFGRHGVADSKPRGDAGILAAPRQGFRNWRRPDRPSG